MRYLFAATLLVLAACTSTTSPSEQPDVAHARALKCPHNVPLCVPCTVENGCLPVEP
jgi:hypothetical protein